MKAQERRVWRILILSIFLALSGLSFFYLRMKEDAEATPFLFETSLREDTSARYQSLKDMPEPKAFKHFIYQKGKTIKVAGRCTDVYRVVLVYPAQIDYRSDPLSSKYNTASLCKQEGDYEIEISLEESHLEDKKEYYIVRAPQGNISGWYDPY